MLKAVLFAAVFVFAARGVAVAADTDLLVGSVRDSSGAPVGGASVRAFDVRGMPAGADRVEADGTFAIVLAAPAVRLEITCAHCRTASENVTGTANVVVVVERYAALENDVPSAADLSALPYGRIADDLALVPFVVQRANGQDISDRGLDGQRGLVIDDGVPLFDFATGSSALVDFPDRYVQSISIAGAQDAFRYGSYAGGGAFSLAPATGVKSYGAADGGAASALALEPAIDGIRPAYGVSSDAGVLARRADLGATEPFAGGLIDASVGSASERIVPDAGTDVSRSDDLMHLAYATASRRYRSFADFAIGEVSLFNNLENSSEYRSSYLSAGVRLEHPAAITTSIGALTTRQTAYALEGTSLTGRSFEETEYAEAKTGTEHDGAHAGFALSDETVLETLSAGRISGQRLALVPSLGAAVPLGTTGLYARADYVQSLRTPTLFETNAVAYPAANTAPQERDEVGQTAFGFDDGRRIRGEAIAYREDTHGFQERSQHGIGASVVWQIAPLLSLRAWTLRASPESYASSYPLQTVTDVSRQVGWLSYVNASGLRFDAIAHRDLDSSSHAVLLDGDVLVPLAREAALDLGSSHTNGARKYSIGIRTR